MISGMSIANTTDDALQNRYKVKGVLQGLNESEWKIIQKQIQSQQLGYIKASNTGMGDNFGWSVSVSGNTLVVGAPGESSSSMGVNSLPNNSANSSGAAYVFIRNGTSWLQQAYLKASNTQAGDNFGTAVAISGDTIVVGATNEDSASTGVDSMPNESASNSGAAYVFFRSGGSWSQQGYLKASNTGASDLFGESVSVSGDTVVVGAAKEGSLSGAAYVFTRSAMTWSQQAFLKALNSDTNDNFGTSVAISGDSIVVGASGESSSTLGVNSSPNNSASSSGAAYAFTRNGISWSQQAYLKASNTESNDLFGTSVAISADTIVVGAHGEDSSSTGVNSMSNELANGAGAVYVFVRSGVMWSQQAYIKASEVGDLDFFGYSVDISNDTLVVGAYWEDSSTTGVDSTPNEGAGDSGAAYAFNRNGLVWSQQHYLKASNTDSGDLFGFNVAASGNLIVVGALFEDSSTMGVDSTPNEGASDSGAAYVYGVPLPDGMFSDGFETP